MYSYTLTFKEDVDRLTAPEHLSPTAPTTAASISIKGSGCRRVSDYRLQLMGLSEIFTPLT